MTQTEASRIIIIGPEEDAREELGGRLSSAGWQVTAVAALDRNEHYRADLVILQAEEAEELAGGCGAVRRHPALKARPLLVIIPERLAGGVDLSAGMDDLVLARAGTTELLLRLRLALWRRDRSGSAQVVKTGDLVIDLTNYVVKFRGNTLELTLKEYELLCYLATNPGRVFTRAVLLNSVWGYEYFGGTRTVDVHVRRLRAKLGDWGEELIQTVRGVGYRFRTG